MAEPALKWPGIKNRLLVLIVFALLLPFTPSKGEEEPMRPTMESVRQSITGYILGDIKLKGGFFLYDSNLMRVVGMRFERVHKSITRTNQGQFIACVDMRDVRGSLYDLDLHMRETDEGLKLAKLVIHKVNGKER